MVITVSYSIMKDETIILRNPGKIQEKILDQYRLTELFRNIYGNYVLDHWPKGAGVRDAVAAVKTFKGVDEVDTAKWKELIIDLMYSRYVLGFKHWEYFVYGLEDKSISDRLEFMPQRNILIYYQALNTSCEDAYKLDNKYLTYQTLTPYFKRDMCNIRGDEQQEEFLEFCRRHPRFMVKPVDSAVGRGIEIVNCEEYSSPEEAFAVLRAKGESMLCEELIVCEDSIEAIHPASVNCVRVFTYLKSNGETTLVCAWLKAGRGGAVIDNGSVGGVMAAVDARTGLVYTDAADKSGNVFPAHPDTGFVFKGFQIPRWEELKKLVLEIAPVFPGVPLIGWDVALSKDRGWQLVEGNARGMINTIQVAIKKGCRKQLEAAFEWDIHRRKPQRTK